MFAEITVSDHAGVRLAERFHLDDLDAARSEIRGALISGRVEHRARNIWYARTAERVYVLAKQRRCMVVITVFAPLAEAA